MQIQGKVKVNRYLEQQLTYLAQKDFSGGLITSPSPLSASNNWSTNDGVLQAQNLKVFESSFHLTL